jgi:hypothetical protein
MPHNHTFINFDFVHINIWINSTRKITTINHTKTAIRLLPSVYGSVSQPPGRGPVLGPGLNYTGPREVNIL